jgi:hypothetical protein
MKFVTVTSVAIGGYLAGLATEKFYRSSSVDLESTDGNSTSNHKNNLLPMPGLPIFGTVSAASMVPSKVSFKEVKGILPEPSNNAPRVSQVINKVMGYNKI